MKKFLAGILTMSVMLCSLTGCQKEEKKVRDHDRRDETSEDIPLLFRISSADKDSFADAVDELYGIRLTDSDFTEDRRIASSRYHCVVNENNVTYIYIEFPDRNAADEYWDTFTSYFDNSYIIENEDQYGYIANASSEYLVMYRNGNVVISAGTAQVDTPMTSAYNSYGGFDDIDEFMHYISYPSPDDIWEGIADMDGIHFLGHDIS